MFGDIRPEGRFFCVRRRSAVLPFSAALSSALKQQHKSRSQTGLTILLYQQLCCRSIKTAVPAALSADPTTLPLSLHAQSQLAKLPPVCYITIRKGDTNVQVKLKKSGKFHRIPGQNLSLLQAINQREA